MKQVTDMDLRELVDDLTGHALMSIGRGESFRSVVNTIAVNALHWKTLKMEKAANAKDVEKLAKIK